MDNGPVKDEIDVMILYCSTAIRNEQNAQALFYLAKALIEARRLRALLEEKTGEIPAPLILHPCKVCLTDNSVSDAICFFCGAYLKEPEKILG